jgi:antitoxin VapB
MPLSIKNTEAEKLARELAARTGETLTEAVTVAVRQRLVALRRTDVSALARQRVERLLAEFDALPDIDTRGFDEILAYDEHGLP